TARRIRYEGCRVTTDEIAEYLRLQGRYCGRLGSPFYATLLERLADDVVAGGPAAAGPEGYPHEPLRSPSALRLLGCAHRLVLTGAEPALAARYPSMGGDGDAGAAWPVFRDVLASRRDELRRAVVERGVQTNEVGRTAALLGGFLLVARETGLRLR